MSDDRLPAYVCENCGRIGPMDAFQEECSPGWTHGRLVKVDVDRTDFDQLRRTVLARQLDEPA